LTASTASTASAASTASIASAAAAPAVTTPAVVHALLPSLKARLGALIGPRAATAPLPNLELP
jgi:hypothetical protein